MASEQVSSPGDGTFRLNDLPPKLQFRVFEYAVTEKEAICFNDGAREYAAWLENTKDPMFVTFATFFKMAKAAQPPITRVNKVIRHDALKMFYQNNDFIAGFCTADESINEETAHKALCAIGVEYCRLMRSLTLVDMFAVADGEFGCAEGKSLDLLRGPLGSFTLRKGEVTGTNVVEFTDTGTVNQDARLLEAQDSNEQGA